jgi:hypothetical protein
VEAEEGAEPLTSDNRAALMIVKLAVCNDL